ncbi:hypothetical protein JW906_11620 [bacterium]|nr:hypothetical protein [bacterium]
MGSSGDSPERMRPGRDALLPAISDSLKGLPVRHIFTNREIRSEMGFWGAQGAISFLIGLSYGSIASAVAVGGITHSGFAAGAGFFLGGLYLAARNLMETEESLWRDAIARLEYKWESRDNRGACGPDSLRAPE